MKKKTVCCISDCNHLYLRQHAVRIRTEFPGGERICHGWGYRRGIIFLQRRCCPRTRQHDQGTDCYIIYQELEAGRLTLETPVRISHNVAVKSRDSNYPTAVPLTEGVTYTVETLLHLIMIPSASASCIAMAEHISGSESAFVARMNQTARSWSECDLL